jgi:hypothetical protein
MGLTFGGEPLVPRTTFVALACFACAVTHSHASIVPVHQLDRGLVGLPTVESAPPGLNAQRPVAAHSVVLSSARMDGVATLDNSALYALVEPGIQPGGDATGALNVRLSAMLRDGSNPRATTGIPAILGSGNSAAEIEFGNSDAGGNFMPLLQIHTVPGPGAGLLALGGLALVVLARRR